MKNNIKSKIKEPQLKLEGEYLEFQNIFKGINQPKLSSQESNNDHSFHYNLIQRKEDLMKLLSSTGIDCKSEILKYYSNLNQLGKRKSGPNYSPIKENNRSKNKNKIMLKKRNEESLKSSETNNKNNKNNFNKTLYQMVNPFNLESNEKIEKNPLINYKKSIKKIGYEENKKLINKSDANSTFLELNNLRNNNKQINIILGKKKSKQLIDFNSITLTSFYQKENEKVKSMDKTNETEDKSLTAYINTDYEVKDSISLAKEIKTIANRNNNTSMKLKKILNDRHYFPLISRSFKYDISDIAEKKFIMKRAGKYTFKKIKSNDLKFHKFLHYDYWNDKKIDKGFIALSKKHEQLKKIMYNKIYYDIKNAESINLELKFGPKNMKLYKKLLQEPKKKFP